MIAAGAISVESSSQELQSITYAADAGFAKKITWLRSIPSAATVDGQVLEETAAAMDTSYAPHQPSSNGATPRRKNDCEPSIIFEIVKLNHLIK